MTEQKSSPKAAPARRSAPRPAGQMRVDADRQARDAAAARVATAWVALCQSEPLMVEMLLPRELREALGELAKANAA